MHKIHRKKSLSLRTVLMESSTLRQLLRTPCGLKFTDSLNDQSRHPVTVFFRKSRFALIKFLLSFIPEGYLHNTVGEIIAQVFFTSKVNYSWSKKVLFLAVFGRYPLVTLKQKLQSLLFGFEYLFSVTSIDSFI